MYKVIAAALIAVSLGACAQLQQGQTVLNTAATTTVPVDVAIAAANSFDILKAGATNYANYCVVQFKKTAAWPSACQAGTRRTVVHAVRAGTAARDQVELSAGSGSVLSTVYNSLVTAVQALQASPAASPQFTAGAQ